MRLKKIWAIVILMTAIACFSQMGCKNNKEELLYPAVPCDTAGVRYSTVIINILRNNCYRCHAGSSTVGPFNLDSYSTLRIRAADGELWAAVSHAPGVTPMPKDLPQLSACDLAKIRKWLDDGYPNN